LAMTTKKPFYLLLWIASILHLTPKVG